MTDGEIVKLIQAQMDDAKVNVRDMTGGGDHYEIEVVSKRFEGLNLIQRHRVLHQILEGPMAGEIHAVKLKTLTPEEALDK